jgi:hypothetical protein
VDDLFDEARHLTSDLRAATTCIGPGDAPAIV